MTNSRLVLILLLIAGAAFFSDSCVRKPIKQTKPTERKIVAKDTTAKNNINLGETIIVKNSVITLSIFDDQREDGDSLSLYLSPKPQKEFGKCVLDKYRLTNKKKLITLTLENPDNYLILHALNLGDTPPNTAAIWIDDGAKRKTVTLSSTLENSGCVLLKYERDPLADEINIEGTWEVITDKRIVYVINSPTGVWARDKGLEEWKIYNRTALRTYSRDDLKKTINVLATDTFRIEFDDGSKYVLSRMK